MIKVKQLSTCKIFIEAKFIESMTWENHGECGILTI